MSQHNLQAGSCYGLKRRVKIKQLKRNKGAEGELGRQKYGCRVEASQECSASGADLLLGGDVGTQPHDQTTERLSALLWLLLPLPTISSLCFHPAPCSHLADCSLKISMESLSTCGFKHPYMLQPHQAGRYECCAYGTAKLFLIGVFGFSFLTAAPDRGATDNGEWLP